MSTRTSEQKTGDAEIVQMPKVDKAPPAEPAAPKKRNGRRIALMASVPVLIAIIGGYFWLSGGRYQETDNAYVAQPKVALSADVSGRIATVAVHENQPVAAGDVLFTLDPAPYSIALAQA